MKITNLYIGVIEKIYKKDNSENKPLFKTYPERQTVLHLTKESQVEDLKYGGTYPVGVQKNSGIGSNFVRPDSLMPMFKIEEVQDEEIEKEKVLELFNSRY